MEVFRTKAEMEATGLRYDDNVWRKGPGGELGLYVTVNTTDHQKVLTKPAPVGGCQGGGERLTPAAAPPPAPAFVQGRCNTCQRRSPGPFGGDYCCRRPGDDECKAVAAGPKTKSSSRFVGPGLW